MLGCYLVESEWELVPTSSLIMRRDVSALCAKSFPAHRAGGRAWRLLHVCGLVILPIFAAQQATGDTSCEVPRILDVDGIVVPAILPVERVRWGPEKDQPFTEAALQRGKPVVFEGTEYAADCPAAKWTLESVATTLSSPVLENVKRYPALPGAPLFATGMRMARVPEIMATYTPHFSRHNVGSRASLPKLALNSQHFVVPAGVGDIYNVFQASWRRPIRDSECTGGWGSRRRLHTSRLAVRWKPSSQLRWAPPGVESTRSRPASRWSRT